MITWKNIQLLKEINKQEKQKGIAKPKELNSYKSKTRKYKAIEKLDKINACETHKAPKTIKTEKTIKLTSFGKQLLKKSKKINKKH